MAGTIQSPARKSAPHRARSNSSAANGLLFLDRTRHPIQFAIDPRRGGKSEFLFLPKRNEPRLILDNDRDVGASEFFRCDEAHEVVERDGERLVRRQDTVSPGG